MKNKFDILGFNAVWNDIDNYRDWIKTIRREETDKKSIYNRFNMGRNIFYNIYVIVTLPGEDSNLAEEIQRIRVTESLIPINRYLDETLKFAEYLTPEFNRIMKDKELTLNYLVVYRFSFQRLSISWVLWRLGLIGGLAWGVSQGFWSNIVTWISNLI